MAKCIKIQRKHRKVCIGDLDTFIDIFTRTETTQNFLADVNFTIHQADVEVLWETIKGVEIFDETNVGTISTERIFMPYDADITKEFFIKLEGVFYRILDVEDLERRNEWLKLMLTERGVDTKAVNDA